LVGGEFVVEVVLGEGCVVLVWVGIEVFVLEVLLLVYVLVVLEFVVFVPVLL